MAALTGNSVATSYQGILKTTDNAAIGATEKNLTDGVGNASTLSIGTASASFTGTLDLSGATVTGLPGGAPGLVSGTGTSSMKSADTLTTLPASAPTANSIAIGNNAIVDGINGRPTFDIGHIAIGHNARVQESSFGDFYGYHGIAIGRNALANQRYDGGAIAIGDGADATGMHGIAIGANTTADDFGITMGQNANHTGDGAVCIGRNSGGAAGAINAVNIGTDSNTQFGGAVALGFTAKAFATDSIAIGKLAKAEPFGGSNSIAIGDTALANANGAVALGANVTASVIDCTTVNMLQIANYASLNYADDTAAAAGGVALGQVYHNAGALRIRIA